MFVNAGIQNGRFVLLLGCVPGVFAVICVVSEFSTCLVAVCLGIFLFCTMCIGFGRLSSLVTVSCYVPCSFEFVLMRRVSFSFFTSPVRFICHMRERFVLFG